MSNYIAIDLKSYYSSAECVNRDLDPLNTNLVVADASRTSKTICLAVSPSLKEYGVSSRPRLFEVIQIIKKLNRERKQKMPFHQFTGKSYLKSELDQNPSLEIDFIIVPPRMSFYVDLSAQIYQTYLKYISSDDIHVYSIDEVFMDVSSYLSFYQLDAHQLATKIIRDVYHTTGITATAGIGPNLYLAKVAMDIVAKHSPPDQYGVRIAELDEISYREKLWTHRPLTDFWRIGKGIAHKLESLGLFTMGDIAQASLSSCDFFYRLWGVNAELLIDHAWGYEPTTMSAIKNYHPQSQSLTSGQVLTCPYTYENALVVLKEMGEQLSLDLVEKKLQTNLISLDVGYDVNNLNNSQFTGEVKVDYYGRRIPKGAHGSQKLDYYTSSTHKIVEILCEIYKQKVNSSLLIRRFNISVHNLLNDEQAHHLNQKPHYQQLDFFTINTPIITQSEDKEERQLQETLLSIKNKYGKNAIFKGRDLQEEATALERNNQIGGHKK